MNPIKLILFVPAFVAAIYGGGHIFFDNYDGPINHQVIDIEQDKNKDLTTNLMLVHNTAKQQEDVEKTKIFIDQKIVDSTKEIQNIGTKIDDEKSKIDDTKQELEDIKQELEDIKQKIEDYKQRLDVCIQNLNNDPITKKLFHGQDPNARKYLNIFITFMRSRDIYQNDKKYQSWKQSLLLLKPGWGLDQKKRVQIQLQDKLTDELANHTRLLNINESLLAKEIKNKRELINQAIITTKYLESLKQQLIKNSESIIFMES